MKPVDVKATTYIDSIKEVNNIDHEFKIDDIVRISKYRNISAKATLQIGPKTFLWLKNF